MPSESPSIETTPGVPASAKPRVAIPALLESLMLLWPTLKIAALPLIALHLVSVGANQYFAFATETLMARGKEDLLFIAVTAALEMLFTLVWSAVWTLALASAADSAINRTTRRPLFDLLPRHFNQLLIEQIRVLAGIVWRLPLLILPSVVFYIRMALVPYVVIFDPGYQRGEVDALKESQLRSRGRFFQLLALVILSHALPFVAEEALQGSEGARLTENPLGIALTGVMTFFINSWVGIFLFSVSRRLIRMSHPGT